MSFSFALLRKRPLIDLIHSSTYSSDRWNSSRQPFCLFYFQLSLRLTQSAVGNVEAEPFRPTVPTSSAIFPIEKVWIILNEQIKWVIRINYFRNKRLLRSAWWGHRWSLLERASGWRSVLSMPRQDRFVVIIYRS